MKKTGLHTTEDNHNSCYRILIKALKPRSTLGFALATDPTLTKYCGPSRDIGLTLLTAKTF